MTTPTQGTHVFVLPDGETDIVRIQRYDDIDVGEDSTSRRDVTSIDDLNFKRYETGLTDIGEMSITIRFDEDNPSHIKLIEMANTKKKGKWFIGSSSSQDAPVVSGGNVTLSTSRTWWSCEAKVTPANPKFVKDDDVMKTFKISRTTEIVTTPKA